MGSQKKELMRVSDKGKGAALNLNIRDPFFPAESCICLEAYTVFAFPGLLVEMDVEANPRGK